MARRELQFIRHFMIDDRNETGGITVTVTVKTVLSHSEHIVWQAPSFQGEHPNDERALALIALLNDPLARFAILQHETPPPDYPELDMTALHYALQ